MSDGATALTRLAATQNLPGRADGLCLFVAALGAVLREMSARRSVLDAIDRALQQQLACQEFEPGTREFVDLLRDTLDEAISEMVAAQQPRH